MAIMTFQGTVENGRVQLAADIVLPEKANVLVVVPDAEPTAKPTKFDLAEMLLHMPADSPDHLDAERDDWYRLASQNLAAAYGEDEPEYTLDMIKEANPDYEER